jgi:hypothetical protein
MTAAPEEKFILVSMLNLTQATTVLTKHILLFLNIFFKIRLLVWQIIQTLYKFGNWELGTGHWALGITRKRISFYLWYLFSSEVPYSPYPMPHALFWFYPTFIGFYQINQFLNTFVFRNLFNFFPAAI